MSAMRRDEKIDLLHTLVRFRVAEVAKEKFPELIGRIFTEEDVLDLIAFSLSRLYIYQVKKDDKIT
jgi:hypothetical protein